MRRKIDEIKAYKHQDEGFDFFKNKNYGAIFLEQGLGKSKLAIDIVQNLYAQNKIDAVLLVAPNNVHRQWAKEQLPKHGANFECFLWQKNRGKRYLKDLNTFITKKVDALKWFCVNIDIFSSENHLSHFYNFLTKNSCAFVLDEATNIKNSYSNRFKNLVYTLAIKNKLAYTKLAKYSYILTGMMITDTPLDLWAMFEFLAFDFFKMNYYAFKNKYAIEKTDTNYGTNRKYRRSLSKKEILNIRRSFNKNPDVQQIACQFNMQETNIKYIIDHPNLEEPYKNLDDLKEKIKHCSFIRRKKECLDLPAKIYVKLLVNLTAEQKKCYKELLKEFSTDYLNEELSITNKISLFTRLAQISGGCFPYKTENLEGKILYFKENPKINALKQDLQEVFKACIIFARFVGEIELILAVLKKEFPEKIICGYYGKTTELERDKIKEDFQAGKIDILVANVVCAGVGLNLQAASLCYYYSNSFSLYYRKQSEDRLHRIGQTETVVYKDIICSGTIDQLVLSALENKNNLLEYFRGDSISELGQNI